MPVDFLIRSLDHPVIILPFEQEIGILVIIVFTSALRISSAVCQTRVIAKKLSLIIHISLPCSDTMHSIVCRALSLSH